PLLGELGSARADAKDALHRLDRVDAPPQLRGMLRTLGAQLVHAQRAPLLARGFPAQHQFVERIACGHSVLDCGGSTPLLDFGRRRNPKAQSGAEPPHSKASGVPDAVQLAKRDVPAPLYGSDRDAEQVRGLGLRQTLVKEQADHFALFVRQGIDLAMQLGPLREGGGLVAEIRLFMPQGAVRRALSMAMVIGAESLGPVETAGPIPKLPADLPNRQGQKNPRGFRLFLLERPHAPPP